jgi:hypothetical protein
LSTNETPKLSLPRSRKAPTMNPYPFYPVRNNIV